MTIADIIETIILAAVMRQWHYTRPEICHREGDGEAPRTLTSATPLTGKETSR